MTTPDEKLRKELLEELALAANKGKPAEHAVIMLNILEMGWIASRSHPDPATLKLVEALKALVVSEKNKERIDQVDRDQLQMIVLHASSIAEDAIKQWEAAHGK